MTSFPTFLPNTSCALFLGGPQLPENKHERFKNGVNFRAKIIGIDDVPEARGDRMCQEVLQRQKLAVLAKGTHKQKVIIHVSLDGIKIVDEATMVNYASPTESHLEGLSFGFYF